MRSQFTGSIISNSGAIQMGIYALAGSDFRGVPTLELNNTSIRAGKTVTVTDQVYPGGNGHAAASLINSLGVALLGGAELLPNNTFTMFTFPASGMTLSDASTFDTTTGLWTKGGTTTISATLASPVGSIANTQSATFASSASGNVSLTGLTVSTSYPLTLTLASAGDQATVMAQLAKNPAYSSITANGADKITLQFTAPAATTYFAWDNVHSSAADWYLGGNLTGVALNTTGGSSTPFSTWISGYPGVGALTGLTDNYANDGLPNFLKFALNFDPTSGSSSGKEVAKLATVGADSNVLTLTIAVRDNAPAFGASGNNQVSIDTTDSLTYIVEACTDLINWGTPVVTEVTGADATAIQSGLPACDTGWTYHTFRTAGTPTTVPSDFIHVKVITQ